MQNFIHRFILALIILCYFPPSFSDAQVVSHPTEVIFPIYHDTSAPLSELLQFESLIEKGEEKDREIPNHELPYESTPDTKVSPAPIQDFFGSTNAAVTISNFDAISNLCGCYPPDPNSAVGSDYVLHTANTHFAVYDKQGALVQSPALLAVLFTGVPGGGRSDGDPVVLYDRIANRWVVMQFSVANPYYVLFAVSTSSNPLGTYNRYSYQFTAFPDYPKIAVWRDGYYIGIASYAGGSTYIGDMAAVVERDSMLAGKTARIVAFQRTTSDPRLLPADVDGPLPPVGTPNYFTGVSLGNQRLQVYELAVNWSNPVTSTFTGPTLLSTEAFTAPVCVSRNCLPQPGTGIGLDAIADRLMFRVQYRNFGSYQAMVANHTVKIATAQAGIRWYELRKTSGAWSIYQQGTYAPDANSRWMGSIAMDKFGNIGLGYSVSSSSVMPSIRFTGRLPSDPLGVMTIAETTIVAGTGVQTGTGFRWGDYSSLHLDPYDDATFWYTNEYIPTTSTAGWRTRIASFMIASLPYMQLAGTSITGGNGNGIIDINECNNITLSVRNVGAATATGISAVLLTTTPNVTVATASSSYSDIAPGTTVTNSTAFQITTSPSFVCGTPVVLKLALAHTGRQDTLSFTLPSGSIGAATQFDNNTATSIPDNNATGVEIPITVSGLSGAIAKVTVSLYLTHTWDSDLLIKLIGPDNTVAILSNRRGGNGHNFGSSCSPQANRTTFDDTAATPIASGSAAFIGKYRPDESLSIFNGKSGSALNGTWKLVVSDLAAQDVGTVQCWSLFISSPTCATGSGGCSATSTQQMSAGWNLVSVPVTPPSYDPSVIFPGAVSGTIYSFLSGNYTVPGSLTNGEGYWAFYSSPVSNGITGTPISTASVNVATGNRWVLIGSLTNSQPVGKLTSNPPGAIVSGTIFGYNGTSYFTPSMFEPGRGYWVFVNAACTLTIAE